MAVKNHISEFIVTKNYIVAGKSHGVKIGLSINYVAKVFSIFEPHPSGDHGRFSIIDKATPHSIIALADAIKEAAIFAQSQINPNIELPKIYSKASGKLSYSEKKLVKKISAALEEKIAKNSSFLTDTGFKTATSLAGLQGLYDKYTTEGGITDHLNTEVLRKAFGSNKNTKQVKPTRNPKKK